MVSKTALNKKAAKSSGKPAKKQAAKAAAAKTAAVKKSAKPAPKPARPAKLVQAQSPSRRNRLPPKARPSRRAKTKREPVAKGKKAAPAKAEIKTVKTVKPVAPAPVMKTVAKILLKKPGENEAPGDADSPLLDMSDVGVRKMIARAKRAATSPMTN